MNIIRKYYVVKFVFSIICLLMEKLPTAKLVYLYFFDKSVMRFAWISYVLLRILSSHETRTNVYVGQIEFVCQHLVLISKSSCTTSG